MRLPWAKRSGKTTLVKNDFFKGLTYWRKLTGNSTKNMFSKLKSAFCNQLPPGISLKNRHQLIRKF